MFAVIFSAKMPLYIVKAVMICPAYLESSPPTPSVLSGCSLMHLWRQFMFSSLLFTVTSSALPCDLYFFKLTQPLTVSTVQSLYTVKEKGENMIENYLPFPMV